MAARALKPGVRRAGRRGWPGVALGWLALLLPALPARAADDDALKAAVVYNILLFVEWPGEADAPPEAPLRVCASRGGSLWPQLERLQDRSVRGKRVQLTEVAADVHYHDCNVLVLEGSAAAARAVPRELRGLPVLVVADGVGAVGDGIALSLQMSNGRVVFDADPESARRNGLQLSSRLLRLARNLRQ
jgi:hypothetical protein